MQQSSSSILRRCRPLIRPFNNRRPASSTGYNEEQQGVTTTTTTTTLSKQIGIRTRSLREPNHSSRRTTAITTRRFCSAAATSQVDPNVAFQNAPGNRHDQNNILVSPATLVEDLKRAAAWVPKVYRRKSESTTTVSASNSSEQTTIRRTPPDREEVPWDLEFCRDTANAYDTYLHRRAAAAAAANRGILNTQSHGLNSNNDIHDGDEIDLVSAENVTLAFKVLIKCHTDPDTLSTRVRDWEKCLGQIGQTPLTDHLSLRLLTANGKAGNVGRTLSLLQLRKSKGYRPRRREFVFAITSLQAANWTQVKSRNIFVPDADQPAIDNPTRWLDAILLNMSERDYALRPGLANLMLDCYAAGRTGKAVHHFYRVVREPLPPGTLNVESGDPDDDEKEEEEGGKEDSSSMLSTKSWANDYYDETRRATPEMPRDWFYFPNSGYAYQPMRVKLQYNRGMPPYYKVPAQVRGKLLYRPEEEEGQLKIQRETEPEYSIPLSAAFSFADSLQHGACGHEPMKLNRGSYNALIKACVHRGALWRAMHVLDVTMPTADIKPNIVSYNLVLSGLASVGDVVVAQEYYTKMLNSGLKPDAITVRAIVDGLLNMGDVQGAVTVVQDFFNQHSVLPPYTTHSKILEFCLGRELIFEAKRYVYFIQQLWRWEPNQYHNDEFIKLMRATQKNTQLQKPALQKLFAYFGEELADDDFL